MNKAAIDRSDPPRVGAVNYLNSKPLIHGLDCRPGDVRLLLDLPSRLADSLAEGRVDAALIPSIEFFRDAGYEIVSDACIACRGPVLSVKLFFRVPPHRVRRLALDEGSRTSAALALILLAELYDTRPEVEPLPIGSSVCDSTADAVLLIGDRAIRDVPESFLETWDLGEQWSRWTQLPFVFAMWVGRARDRHTSLPSLLAEARDEGVRQLDQIAVREAALLGIEAELARHYLRDNLHYTLGMAERRGLRKFYELSVRHGLAPAGRAAAIQADFSSQV